jgi:hypothetical protein
MNKLKWLVVVIAGVSVFSGCATILSGTGRTVNIASQDGKKVEARVATKKTVQNIVMPTVLPVSTKNGNITVTIEDPCYESTQTVLTRKFNFVFLVNIITGGLLGSTTDALSSAMWTYDETAVIPVVKKASCSAATSAISATKE